MATFVNLTESWFEPTIRARKQGRLAFDHPGGTLKTLFVKIWMLFGFLKILFIKLFFQPPFLGFLPQLPLPCFLQHYT